MKHLAAKKSDKSPKSELKQSESVSAGCVINNC